MAVSVKIDDDLKARLQGLADQRKRSPHWMMREAIREYVERGEKLERLNRQEQDSWAHFQETGLHITGEELFAWMDTWGTDEDTGPPECHV